MARRKASEQLLRRELLLMAMISLVAIAFRVNHLYDYFGYFQSTYGIWDAPDRIGESYHRWLMSLLTIRNGFVYSDFKPMPNLALVWLPLLQYATIPAMLITGNFTIWPERFLNVAVGAAASALVYYACRRIFGYTWYALVGSLLLAFQPWHVDFSIMGTAKVFVALFITLQVLSYITRRGALFFLSSSLGMLTSYEAWFTTGFLALLAPKILNWPRSYGIRAASLGAIPMLWMLWSTVWTGNPFAWVLEYLSDIGWRGKADPSVSLFYFNVSLVMTLFVFFVAIVAGLLKNRESRLIAALLIAYTAYYSTAHVLTLDPGDIARVVPILPLVAICAAPAIPRPGSTLRRRLSLGLLLLAILFATYAFQIGIGPRKAYVIMPEYRAAHELARFYASGNVVVDSPIVIYYSRIDPVRFISFSSSMGQGEELGIWLREHNVTFLVWINATFSRSSKLLPELASAREHRFGDSTLQPIYEESLRARRAGSPHWEFDQPGTPDIVLYKVTFARPTS